MEFYGAEKMEAFDKAIEQAKQQRKRRSNRDTKAHDLEAKSMGI